MQGVISSEKAGGGRESPEGLRKARAVGRIAFTARPVRGVFRSFPRACKRGVFF